MELMNFNEYQEKAKKTDTYQDKPPHDRLFYATLGLVGESGEVAEKVKKILRDQRGAVSEEKRQELKKELGDVLWYVAKFARELEFTLDEVAAGNIEKLYSRLERDAIHGSGDNR
ncbi:MAG: MazG family pyrophosphatase [Parcubacteria group bacterium Gr01-1014_72]|nr:MAG: MazG family pyrophosphatase [Parcubacteria group bacterium Gr01-1014_72]